MVAEYVEKNAVLADIGSDHAYLPTYLVKKGTIQKAIAGEVVKGPYDSAVKNVKREEVADHITVRLANGLQAIHEEDGVSIVTIAGMGGPLIAKILEEGKALLTSVKRIITQPNIHAGAIREWAILNEWTIIDEKILKEDDKIYEIVVLERGKGNYTPLAQLLGPKLMREKHPVFHEKWQREVNQWKQILKSLEGANQDEAVQMKKNQLLEKIEQVERVLHD